MIDPELKQLLDKHFGSIDEQFDLVIRTTKEGFDAVDARFTAVDARFTAVDARFTAVDARFTLLEKDIAFLKQRVAAIADEVQVLSANMVTKQYLDARMDAHLGLAQKAETKMEAMRQTIFALMFLLEKHHLLPSTERAKYEALLAA
ncbi:hypothetical protein HY480_04245 [Candidatus Uhrbacteria bacterium]|nr:hypothetical protein [Candidatus Uhrbacteria bacterium]